MLCDIWRGLSVQQKKLVAKKLASLTVEVVDATLIIKKEKLQALLDAGMAVAETTHLLSWFSAEYVDALRQAPGLYLDAANAYQLRRLAAGAMSVPGFLPAVDVVASAVHDAGPGVLKILQGLVDRLPEGMKEKFATVKSSIRPMPTPVMRAIVEQSPLHQSERGQIEREDFDEKSVASASIGQGHLAMFSPAELPEQAFAFRIRPDKVGVFVKVRRSTLDDDLAMEKIFFQSVLDLLPEDAKRQKGRDAVAFVHSLEQELDWKREIGNMRLAYDLYSGNPLYSPPPGKNVTVTAPKVVDIGYPEQPTVIVMSRAQGPSVDKWLQTSPPPAEVCNAADALFEAYRTWTIEAYFGEGFFHADPHGGNMHYHYDAQSDQGTLTLLDFGNATQVNRDELRNTFFMGLLTTLTGDPATFLNSQNVPAEIVQTAQAEVQAAWDDLKGKGFQSTNLGKLPLFMRAGLEVVGKHTDQPPFTFPFIRAIFLWSNTFQEFFRRFGDVLGECVNTPVKSVSEFQARVIKTVLGQMKGYVLQEPLKVLGPMRVFMSPKVLKDLSVVGLSKIGDGLQRLANSLEPKDAQAVLEFLEEWNLAARLEQAAKDLAEKIAVLTMQGQGLVYEGELSEDLADRGFEAAKDLAERGFEAAKDLSLDPRVIDRAKEIFLEANPQLDAQDKDNERSILKEDRVEDILEDISGRFTLAMQKLKEEETLQKTREELKSASQRVQGFVHRLRGYKDS